jgi:hypothetical protein
MNQLPTLQQLEYMETGFEVSKVLAQAGYRMDQVAFSITWGQIAEEIAHTLADHGLPADRLDEDFLVELAQGALKVLQKDDQAFWRTCIRTYTSEHPTLVAFVNPPFELDDEGPLTEQYENAVRVGDDESFWVDGGASASLFDDF